MCYQLCTQVSASGAKYRSPIFSHANMKTYFCVNVYVNTTIEYWANLRFYCCAHMTFKITGVENHGSCTVCSAISEIGGKKDYALTRLLYNLVNCWDKEVTLTFFNLCPPRRWLPFLLTLPNKQYTTDWPLRFWKWSLILVVFQLYTRSTYTIPMLGPNHFK